ncbi:hypothetical protein CLD22_24265 [Rubrivivax gelatinosus]|uniref:hypothetical protein n=1 Tax=Rubrivivax gelatinosus TaxID=28068 RepID=UPI00190760DA|nr:hypothetical protein [Rubrivivax gelatinosus]MBZ8142991.1 hypothetical protein [Rubrivivax gelatinosus]
MDWLADILKNLAISKTLVVAIFVTVVVMYFGPILAPLHVPAVQKEFAPYLFASMVLTGCLIAAWTIVGAWHFSRAGLQKAGTVFTRSSLIDEERAILFLLAKNPTQPINLENIDYTRAPGTKLEFHQLAKGLEAKGLVDINDWDENLISLTEKGRARALEIQREAERARAT